MKFLKAVFGWTVSVTFICVGISFFLLGFTFSAFYLLTGLSAIALGICFSPVAVKRIPLITPIWLRAGIVIVAIACFYFSLIPSRQYNNYYSRLGEITKQCTMAYPHFAGGSCECIGKKLEMRDYAFFVETAKVKVNFPEAIVTNQDIPGLDESYEKNTHVHPDYDMSVWFNPIGKAAYVRWTALRECKANPGLTADDLQALKPGEQYLFH